MDPSRIAAFFLGPKVRMPAASSSSTRPPTRGSSMPTMTRSMAFSFAKATILSNSMAPMGSHCAYSAMPALPGVQYIFSALGLFATQYAIACSLPPLPTINTFIGLPPVFPALPDPDFSVFHCHPAACYKVNGLWQDLPLCLLHHAPLKDLGGIPLLHFHSFL